MKKIYPYGPAFLSYLILLYGMILLMGCSSDYYEPNDSELGFDYFPLVMGSYRTLEVVDIRYSVSNGKDSSFYYLKEVIMDSSVNQTGEISYYVYQYKRKSPSESWEDESVLVHTVKRTRSNLVQYEGNVPYVKLTFPVKTGLTWDGNAFNTSDPMYYHYNEVEMIAAPIESLNGRLIQVVQSDYDDQIIRKDFRYEIYATGIGLVFKENSILEYCQEPDCFGKKEISSGKTFRQTLIDYGKE